MKSPIDDNLNIKINLNGNMYSLTIKREDEEIVRAAAMKVNNLINIVNEMYDPNTISMEQKVTLVAYQFAMNELRQSKSYENNPYKESITKVEKELERLLRNDSKNL